MKLTDEILAKTALVVAHPDDEVLWFSSVLNRVRETIICYLDYPDWPLLKQGREATLRNYPISNVRCLGMSESKSFNLVDWKNPEPVEYGLKLTKSHRADALYREGFSTLVSQLKAAIEGFDHVISHNPWGEYGHERHVQVYRAVCELQKGYGFRQYFTNYASNRSFYLMDRYIRGFQNSYCRMETDADLAQKVADVYKENRCWTWYDNYQWFQEEFFMEDTSTLATNRDVGHLSPINLIKIDFGLDHYNGKTTYIRGLKKRLKHWMDHDHENHGVT